MRNYSFKNCAKILPSGVQVLLIAALVLQSSGLTLSGTYGAFQISASIPGNSVTTAGAVIVDDVVVVQPEDLADDKVAELLSPSSWFFYNDENDTINNTLGSFVAGPGTPPLGGGSAQISVSGTQRRNLATYMFRDVSLSDITEMSFVTYNPSAGNGGGATRSAFLNFNVSFDGTDTWQRRLTFVPTQNDTVLQDTWQEWDAIDGGNALWGWSGFVANGNKWPDGATSTLRTWNDLLASFPNIRTRASDSWLGLRVGEPYSNGYTENIDSFTFGTTDGWNATTTTYDFEPVTITSSSEMIVINPDDMKGWAFFQEAPLGAGQIGQMATGPGTPPLGTGSAQFILIANSGQALGTEAYRGVKFADIEELKYSTYRTSGAAALAPSLSFEFDNDTTDADTGWRGRIIYEPYHTQTVNTGEWQEWDTLNDAAGTGTGNWWGSSNGLSTLDENCPQSNPCTWAQVKALYPNAGIRDAGALTGLLLFKAGSGWASFDGNVDKFVIGVKDGVSTHTTTYDFEAAPADNSYVPVAGDVVINEVMWMGSDPSGGGSTADEWIELRNMTAYDIDLAGWTIENLGTQPNPNIVIPSGTITAGGYFLVANYASNHSSAAISNFITADYVTTDIQLLNSGEQLTLRDDSNNIIDQTPTGSWAAGNNTGGLFQSMERNDVPGDGTSTSSWHTCIDSGCTSTAFWDVSSDNYGTPRALNLSENDPTTPDYVDQDWSHTVGWVADENDLIDDSETEEVQDESTSGDSTASDEVGPDTSSPTDVSDDLSETDVVDNGADNGDDTVTEDEEIQDESQAEDAPLTLPEEPVDTEMMKDEDESDSTDGGQVADEVSEEPIADDEVDEEALPDPEPDDSGSEVVSEAE